MDLFDYLFNGFEIALAIAELLFLVSLFVAIGFIFISVFSNTLVFAEIIGELLCMAGVIWFGIPQVKEDIKNRF